MKRTTAEIREYCDRASPAPWFTLDSQWRGEDVGGCVLSESADPMRGTRVLDSVLEEDWPEDDPDFAQSDADLQFAANARTDLVEACDEIDRLRAALASRTDAHDKDGHALIRTMKERDEMEEALDDVIKIVSGTVPKPAPAKPETCNTVKELTGEKVVISHGTLAEVRGMLVGWATTVTFTVRGGHCVAAMPGPLAQAILDKLGVTLRLDLQG